MKLLALILLRSVIFMVLRFFELMLFGRAILSWFPDSDNETLLKIQEVLFVFTEPILEPMRRFLYRFEWVRTCPLDLSFTAVFLLIIILEMIV